MQFWDAATGAAGRTLKAYHAVAFLDEGRTVASDPVTADDGARAALWDRVTGKTLRTFHLDTGMDGDLVAFSPDGRWVACGTPKGSVSVYDAATGRRLRGFPDFPGYGTRDDADTYLSALTFSPNSRLLAADGPGGTVKLWDAATSQLVRTLPSRSSPVTSLAFSSDGTKIAVGGRDAEILVFDVGAGQVEDRLIGHDGPVRSLAFSPDGALLASGGDDATTRLWDMATGQERCRLITFPDGTWVVAAPDGRFDTNDIDNARSLHWVIPDAPFTPLPLELFMRQYYEPRLLERILARDPALARPVPSIADLNRIQPVVKITGVAPHPGDDPTLVDVTVQAQDQTGAVSANDPQPAPQRSGVYDLRLFRDGQLVGYLPIQDEGQTPVDLSADAPGGTLTRVFTVRLPRDGGKRADFSAYAFNGSQIKSETDRLAYLLPQPLPVVKGNAYVISLGVNSYQDPRWDLQFAANDARRTVDSLTRDLQQSGRFAHIISLPLVSDAAAGSHDATRAALKAVLDELAGQNDPADALAFAAVPAAADLPPARPEDLVILTFSCHGDNDSRNGDFYLFPADIGASQEQGLTEDLKAHAISSNDLSRWLRDVDAGQIALIVDACHSAATVDEPGFKPGPMGSRGLGQLAYDKGMRVLAASQADDVAIESNALGDGLLTFALVHDGLEAGQADSDPRDGTVTLAKWLRYGTERVPTLYRQVLSGRVETFGLDAAKGIPLGPKGVVLTNAPAEAAPALQQPALFDFNRQAQDPVLEVLPHP